MKTKSIILGLFAVVAFAFSSTKANAQEVFSQGQQTITVGVGLFSNQLGTLTIPPITASYERCVKDGLIDGKNGSIGIGAMGGYYATGIKNEAVKTYLHSGLLGGRASFHYEFIPKLDTYAGLFLGATITGNSSTAVTGTGTKTDIKNEKNAKFGFGWGLHAGARYYFTPNFAANIEAGYGYSVLNLGLTYRF